MSQSRIDKMPRRKFLRDSFAAGVAAGLAVRVPWSVGAEPEGANGDIRVAVIGCGSMVGNGGKGAYHIHNFSTMEGVRLVAVCDVDEQHLNREVDKLNDAGKKVDGYRDFRKLLERKDIDAVCIATPNHWHALMTILAVQAGKDVYVEKPSSHNVWEGRKTVEAARKYNRIVQVGTQSRSDNGAIEAIKYTRDGNIGNILAVRGICYKPRNSIGKVDGPQEKPASVDYNLWTGPAPLKPLMRKNLHYDWHWVWDTGNGEIGNQGVHQMDLARWALGESLLPPRVLSIGGRFGYDDDAETPNTQIVFFDYKKAPLIFEIRGLPRNKDVKAMDYYNGVSVGFVVECEGGYFAGNNGGFIYDKDGKKMKQVPGGGAEDHPANFIKAVRSRKQQDLNADILEGHISSSLCHVGNISYRLGKESAPGQVVEAVKDTKGFSETFERFQKHLAAHEIDLKKNKPELGAWLEMDAEKEKFRGVLAEKANDMLTRAYRQPFAVPEKV